jgi:hypothetical protein
MGQGSGQSPPRIRAGLCHLYDRMGTNPDESRITLPPEWQGWGKADGAAAYLGPPSYGANGPWAEGAPRVFRQTGVRMAVSGLT